MTAPLNDWLNKDKLFNWSGCYEYSVGRTNLHQPKSVEEVRELVRRVQKIRVLGSRHCFHGIADSKYDLLWTNKLDQIYDLDNNRNTVTIGPGLTYGSLAQYLFEHGFALPNMASLPHISVGGSVATATHGSGLNLGCLSTSVSELEIVKANGEIVNLKKDRDEDFAGAVVALGGVGVVTKLTLDLVPNFSVQQIVYLDLPMNVLKENFREIMLSGYSVSFFTKFANKNIDQVWIKSIVGRENRTDLDLEKFGAKKLVDLDVHPIIELSPIHSTEQRGVPGPWHERLPHFKIGFQPGHGVEVQSEYYVPIEHAYEAIMAIEKHHEKIAPLVWIAEIRVVDADDLWLSPCYKQQCMAISFTWKQEIDAVK